MAAEAKYFHNGRLSNRQIFEDETATVEENPSSLQASSVDERREDLERGQVYLEPIEEGGRGSTCGAICSLMISIPSLVPKTLEDLFYALEPLITGILLTNILQFAYMKCAKRTGTHWQKWGPAWLILISTVCSMAMPLAVLFIYVGRVGYPEYKMWHSGSWFPNTVHGAILYFMKWAGVGCMIVGVLQVTQLHIKIARKWRELRGRPDRPVVAKAAGEPAVQSAWRSRLEATPACADGG